MVTLNFTLVVELALFLMFLWATGKVIIAPLVREMDARDDYVEQNLQRVVVDTDLASAQEKRYAREMARMRRKAEEQLRQNIRAASDEQGALFVDKKRQADRAVVIAKENATKALLDERTAFALLVPELADQMIERLGLEGSEL